jgi:hypothetical protein
MANPKLFAALLAGLLLSFGCSKDNSTNPYEDATDYESLYMDIFNVSSYDSVDIIVADSADMEMGLTADQGDSVAFDIDGQAVYVIAYDGAVTNPVDITMDCRMLEFIVGGDSSRKAMYCECGPDGQAFESAIMIDFDPAQFNNHPTSNVVKLYQHNDSTNKWSMTATQQKSQPRARFGIGHFSKYAIAD